MEDTICYNNFVDKIELGENCRALWLAVIQQTIADSGKSNKNARRDLPRAIYTDWWKQLFIFAGIENELKKVNEIIIKNCNIVNKYPGESVETFDITKKRKYTYRHATTKKP